MKEPPNVRLLVEKGRESLGVARELLVKNHCGFSAARSYYAMFYLAEAALLHKGRQYATHSGIISGFAAEFVKTGVFPVELSRSFQRAFDLRSAGDYSVLPVSREDAEYVLRETETFVETVSNYLRHAGYDLEG